jgi:hypothetical protein
MNGGLERGPLVDRQPARAALVLALVQADPRAKENVPVGLSNRHSQHCYGGKMAVCLGMNFWTPRREMS